MAVWARQDGANDWDIKHGSDSIDGTGFLVENVEIGPRDRSRA